MIGTIGSLVQETANRRRWLVSASLYTVACLSTATLLGATLGAAGHLVSPVHGAALYASLPEWGAWVVGLLALAYALSDVGVMPLPRPALREAVPITWWRWWRPYGAALAYGAALGLGVMTRIPFGAFYVLCVWCVLKGDAMYGAMVMGTYGAARALVMFPASWGVYRHRGALTAWLRSPLFDVGRAQRILAVALIMFGALVLVATVLTGVHPSS
jgi:sulfite exporter TauE/SafE